MDGHCTCLAFCPQNTHSGLKSFSFILILFYNRMVPLGFLPLEIRVAFSRESQLQRSCATQPIVHAGHFSVSIVHRSLTWTTGSLMCTQMLIHRVAHGDV